MLLSRFFLLQRKRSALVILLFSSASAYLIGCGGSGTSVSNSMLPPVFSGASGNLSETPLAASDFVNAVGINLHMTYGGTPYDTDFSKWGPILMRSGIKHVRDAVCPQNETTWCVNVEAARVMQLSATGIKFDLLTSLGNSIPYVTINTQPIITSVEAYEGPNECDVSLDCGASWPTSEQSWQQQLYSLSAPGITVIGPSMVTPQGYTALGNLSEYMDVGNIHDYPATNPPESSAVTPIHLSWEQVVSGPKPVWSTEVNYSSDVTYQPNGVPYVVQERYLPRLLLEHLRLGVARTYIYQLFDYGTDGGAYQGLLDANYQPKPAWTRLLQLINFFQDNAASPRASLHYAISGSSSGRLDHLLFQKSDGTYLLAIWLAETDYDAVARTVLNPPAESIGLTLPNTVASAMVQHFDDGGQVTGSQFAVINGMLSLPVSSRVTVVSFRT